MNLHHACQILFITPFEPIKSNCPQNAEIAEENQELGLETRPIKK
jgi:hypothetical protein